ncbi:hypothetical protein BD311DRAFT_773859 [Dichomitus squalens]|uniref:Uncharacterized protein n=1 Tax=Dichomitus squalens TaxID=114155 RepID=A0A4Q9N231_9APHY|nr:hypothetical protein BD311DRAFT_773859 [Dichomitus squalens]
MGCHLLARWGGYESTLAGVVQGVPFKLGIRRSGQWSGGARLGWTDRRKRDRVIA